MTAPKPWSDPDTDATSLERALLAAGRDRRMPEADRRASLARLTSAVHAGGLEPSAAPPTATSTSPSLFATPLAKGLVVSAGIAALATVGLLLPRPRSAQPTPPAEKPSTAAPRTVGTATSASDTPREATRSPPVAVGAPSASSAVRGAEQASRAVAETRLREESLLVLEVRRTLRAGDPARALARLTEAESTFGRGGLGQEREALMIEALFASGRTAVAARRAEAFLRAFPKSPHAERVRHLAGL
jgi:hypothetical protein